MASLTEILILRGVVPIENLDTVSGSWGEDEEVVKSLVERGIVTPVQLASARAAQADLPFVELLDFPVDRTAVALVPAAVCRRYQVLPIGIVGDVMTLAMVDPGDVFAIDDVRAAARMQVKPVVVEEADLRSAIDRYHRADGELNDLTTALEEESSTSTDVEVSLSLIHI